MKDFAAIDFETANRERSSVCSVGAVIVRDGRIVDSIYRLIRPRPHYYSSFCTRIHGLTAADTAAAPEFPAVWREVAERMMASPSTKSYGAYTVKLALFAEVTGSFAVGPANFMPRPHVDSAVVRLDRRDLGQPREVVQAACTMADAAFFARRKTIANSCRQYFSGRDRALADVVPHILAAAGVDAAVRGETLTPAQFLALGEALRAQRRA